ncbi:MAG: hypothetical protein AB4080_12725 [Trichodesmium sp.]
MSFLIVRTGGHNSRIGNNFLSFSKIIELANVSKGRLDSMQFSFPEFDMNIKNILKIKEHKNYFESFKIREDISQLIELVRRSVLTYPSSASSNIKEYCSQGGDPYSKFQFGDTLFILLHDLSLISCEQMLEIAEQQKAIIIANDPYYLKIDVTEERLNQIFIDFFELKSQLVGSLEKIRKTTNNQRIVSIHIRRGDYERYHNGRFFYSHNYYQELIVRIKHNFADVSFIITSDEPIPPEIEAFSNPEFSYLLKENSIFLPHELDLLLLSLGNIIIGPPSTFSKFASKLSMLSQKVKNPALMVPLNGNLDSDLAVVIKKINTI